MITTLFNQNSELIGLIVEKTAGFNEEQMLIAYMPTEINWVAKKMILNNDFTLDEQYRHTRENGIIVPFEEAVKKFSLDKEGLQYAAEAKPH